VFLALVLHCRLHWISLSDPLYGTVPGMGAPFGQRLHRHFSLCFPHCQASDEKPGGVPWTHLAERRKEKHSTTWASAQPRDTVVSDDRLLLQEACYLKIIAVIYTFLCIGKPVYALLCIDIYITYVLGNRATRAYKRCAQTRTPNIRCTPGYLSWCQNFFSQMWMIHSIQFSMINLALVQLNCLW
jgi:hypothetical protein